MGEEYRYFREENIVSLPLGLWRSIEKHPKKTALRFIGRSFSYEELGKSVSTFADITTSFAPRLITGQQEKIAILMPNIPQFVFAYYGTLLSGNIAVPINFTTIAKELKKLPVKEIKLTPEIEAQIIDSEPRLIFATDFFWPILEQLDWRKLPRTHVIFTSPGEFLPCYLKPFYPLRAMKRGQWVRMPERENIAELHEFLKRPGGNPMQNFKEDLERCPQLNELAQIQYTSGTTKTPKGAMLTHRNLSSNAWQCREAFGDFLGEEEIVLGVLPFFHIFGLTVCLNDALIALGGTLVLQPEFIPEEVLVTIQNEKVTLFPGANVMFHRLGDRLTACRHVPKLCVSGAGALDKEIKQSLTKAGVTILEGYGLSEASPVISVELPNRQAPGSIGVPLPGTEVRIIDVESGEEKIRQEEGEMWARGPQVMLGYWGKPEETARAITEDGWLRTGDIGKFDENGLLRIVDRAGNVGKVNGENVYGAPIEKFAAECRAIKDKKCAIIFGPHTPKGQAPILLAVFDPRRSAFELHEHLKNIPNHLWKIQEIIPVNEEVFDSWTSILGKVNYKKAKEYYKEQKGAA